MTEIRAASNIRSPDNPIPQTIIAIDPGHTTGLALYRRWANRRSGAELRHTLIVDQYGPAERESLVDKLKELSPAHNPAIIVFEKYVARPTQHGHLGGESQLQFSPIYVHGYMVGAMETCRKPLEMPTFVPQQASEMASFPDNRLKAMFPQLFALTLKPAQPHARDALRHLLVYLKRHHFDHYSALIPQN